MANALEFDDPVDTGRRLEFDTPAAVPAQESSFISDRVNTAIDRSPIGFVADIYKRGLKGELITPEEESKLRGFAMGAADPSVGIAQFVANKLGFGDPVNQAIASKEAEYQAGRESAGREGFDAMRMAGNVASPVTVLGMKGLSQVAPAATAFERARQGAGVGGAMGLSTPVTEVQDAEDFEKKKIQQELIGIGFGAVVPATMDMTLGALRALKNIIKPHFSQQAITQTAGRVARDVAGERTDDVIAALERAQQGETAAQAAVPAGSTEFAALQRITQRGQDPSGFRANRLAEEQRIADMWEELNRAVWPLGRKELETANIAGKMKPQFQNEADRLASAAASKVEDVRRFTSAAQRADDMAQTWYPVEGMPRTPGRYSRGAELEKRAIDVAGRAADDSLILGEGARFAQRQADSLAAHGLRPLESRSIIDSINSTMNVPGKQASKVVQQTLGELKTRIDDLSTDGVLNAHDLYTIRKEIGNSIKLYSKENQNWDKSLTAGLEKNIQKAIDDAIEKAGGTRWKEYLAKYSEGAQKITDRVAREKEATKMASEGMTRARAITGQDEIPISIPNVLSRPVMIINAILRKAQGVGSEKTNAEIARLMQNPREMAAVMKAATPSQRAELMKIMAGRGIYIAGSQAAARETGAE